MAHRTPPVYMQPHAYMTHPLPSHQSSLVVPPLSSSPVDRGSSPSTAVIRPRRSSFQALDGGLSAHAHRYAPDEVEDAPTAPLAHRPSMVRLNSGQRSRRSPQLQSSSPSQDAAMAGFHAIQADTEALEQRMERRRQSLLTSRRDASAAGSAFADGAGYSAAHAAQVYADEYGGQMNASASFDFDEYVDDLEEEKGDSEARRSKSSAASTSASAAQPPSTSAASHHHHHHRSSHSATHSPTKHKRTSTTAPQPTRQAVLNDFNRHHSHDLVSYSGVVVAPDLFHTLTPPSDLPDEEKHDRESRDRPVKNVSAEPVPRSRPQLVTVASPTERASSGGSNHSHSSGGLKSPATSASSAASSTRASPEQSPRHSHSHGGQMFQFGAHDVRASSTSSSSASAAFPVRTSSPLKSRSEVVAGPKSSIAAGSASSPASAQSSPTTPIRSTRTLAGISIPTRPSIQPLSMPPTPNTTVPTRYQVGFEQQSHPTPTSSSSFGSSLPTPTNGVASSASVPATPTGLRSPPTSSPTSTPSRSRTRRHTVSFMEGADLVRQDQTPLPRSRFHNRAGVRTILKPYHHTPTLSRNLSPTLSQSQQYHHAHAFHTYRPLSPQDRLQRFAASLSLEQQCIHAAQSGASLIKYNSSGKPQKRWFFVEEDEFEWKLLWESVKKDGNENRTGLNTHLDSPPHSSPSSPPNGLTSPSSKKSNSSTGGILPFFQIGKWKFNPERERSLIDVTGIHYGPYYSVNFCSFLDRLAAAATNGGNSSSSSSSSLVEGKPWLCFSVQFSDRTIDLMGSDERQVTQWFLALQSLAPLSVFHMTRPMLIWQRTIMKLNFYGLEHVKNTLLKQHPDHHLHRQHQTQHHASRGLNANGTRAARVNSFTPFGATVGSGKSAAAGVSAGAKRIANDGHTAASGRKIDAH